jgi:hypothetical protein
LAAFKSILNSIVSPELKLPDPAPLRVNVKVGAGTVSGSEEQELNPMSPANRSQIKLCALIFILLKIGCLINLLQI